MFYELPENLAEEQAQFAQDIAGYVRGEINGTQFKALRVAHGVYEQRQNDTYMIRIRCASGAVTPRQLRRVAEIAEQYGSDEVHFTTRQELQIHDVLIQDVIAALTALRKEGLSTRGGGGNTIRNILTSQDSGISNDEAFDADPYAMALTTRMIAESDSWNLPRKFKIAFSTNEADTAFTQATCLGFLATQKNGEQGFRVYVGGGMGARPMVGNLLMEFIPVSQVYHVTRTLKTIFDAHGNRRSKTTSRLKFLWKKLQREGFEKIFFEEYDRIKDDKSLALDIEPFRFKNEASDLAGLKEKLPVREIAEAEKTDYEEWRSRYVTPQKQAGLLSIRVPLRLGDLKRVDAERLCDFLEILGPNTMRCGRNQNIILRNIPEIYASNAYHLVMSMQETLVRFPAFFSNMINCTGASTCKLGICLPRGLSDAIRDRLATSKLPLDHLEPTFRMNMSGCPNTCGMHHIAHLGFFGKVLRKNGQMYPGYNVLAGARVGWGETSFAKKVGEIAARHVPNFVHDFLDDYLSAKASSAYNDYESYLEERGVPTIERLCAHYKDVPTIEEDKIFYTDFGAKRVISLKEIGTAECSAGMFDMIGVDRKSIKTARKTLSEISEGTDGADLSDAKTLAEVETLLYQITRHAARMLLVTRGLDGRNDTQIFALFQKHFIQTELISPVHLAVIQEAQRVSDIGSAESDDAAAMLSIDKEEAVLQCADAVENLYQSMDDSLRFTKKVASLN